MRTLLSLLAALLTLTACSPTPQKESPPTSPSPEPSSASPAPSQSPEPTQPEPEPERKNLIVEALDISLLPEATPQSTTSNAPAFYGAWFDVGAEALTQALAEFVTTSTADWAADQSELNPLGEDHVAIPELNLQTALTAAGERVVGMRVRTLEFAGASTGTSYRTFWYDVAGQAVGGSETLFTGDGRAAALEAISGELEQILAGTFPDAVAGLQEEGFEGAALDSVNFATDGSLVVEFDDYSVAAGSEGLVQVHLDADRVAPWLSEFGQRAQAAAQRPERPEFAAEPETPSPEPSETASDAPSETPSTPPNSTGHDCSQLKCVAITFDDGPGAHTGRLLDILASEGVAATFYVVGPNVDAHPDLVRRMVEEGHQVGNHSWTHRQMTALSTDEILKEVRDTDAAVERASGRRTSTVRPPYGAINDKVRSALAQHGAGQIITWSVDTLDWKTRSAAATEKSVRDDTRTGAIILMHDIHSATVDAVPGVVRHLKSEGYTLVTVDDLLAAEDPQPGKVYSKLG